MRRELMFENLDQAISESEALLGGGYSQTGKWSLAQVCCHLRLTIESNLSGYPTWMVILGYPLRPILRTFALPKLLAGRSPSGVPTAGIFVPANDLDDGIEVDQFKACVIEFQNSKGTPHAHPGFGGMTKAEFERFHAAHAAHHLSFLGPQSSDEKKR